MGATNPGPLVGMGLPVFNGAGFLEPALDSILAQTYADFELIVCDNASTDRTEEICRAYAAKDPRIRYERSAQNLGLAWNFNRARELSRHRYFKWVAHDDVCAPDFVRSCVDVLERMPAVVLCYPRAILIDGRGQHVEECVDGCHLASPQPSERFRELLANLRLSNPLFGVIRASALRPSPLGSYPAADVVLLGELALRGGFHEVPQRLFFRRDHPQKGTRSHPSVDQQAVLYDPRNRGKTHLMHWKLLREHLRSIARVPMTPRERARCYAFMARSVRWNWRHLVGELWMAARRVAGR
jgi:glycosyltransferase involved in cell wall biosynthesis